MLALFRQTAVLAILGMAIVAPAPARADHWHGHLGFYFSVPLYAPYYYPQPWFAPYPAPYYGYPPAAYGPPAYVERSEPQGAPPPQTAYWYYCPDSNAYYPYVTSCPSAWQPVPPEPPAAPR